MAWDDRTKESKEGLPSDYSDEGEDLTRILALSDGVFAFAMTLLVIYLAIPTVKTNGQLGDYLKGNWVPFFAYALAFFIIGNWWSAHHRLFRLLHRYDRSLVAANLVFLLFIAITPFDVGLVASYSGFPVAVGFYGVTQALAGCVLLALWISLRRSARALVRPKVPDAVLRQGAIISTLAPALFGLSVPVALMSPYASMAIWGAIFPARFVLRRAFRRSPGPVA
jgi:uncharacterized membrane protein